MSMLRWKSMAGLVLLGGLLGGLSGCEKHVPAYVQNPVVSNLTNHERDLLNEIQASGIQIIKRGMIFTFVIPTDCFFVKETHTLKPHREKVLDRLAQFIHQYGNYFQRPRLSITGYTDDTWLYPARDRLSLRYAEIISNYFQEDGIDPSIMEVSGKGMANPIASNHYPMGTAFNRRVEVIVH